ncbi:MAG: hypothetical protein VXZ84_11280, partial [Planctomycetota bacterium]|nr:hypothetical protein [Planctomycetota bacterium]
MASPFAVFRKYQAAFLVIFGVLIIVIFTIGDSVSRLTDTGGGDQEDPIVVRWKGTELTESQLQRLQYGKQDVLNAVYSVQNAAMAKGAFPRFMQQATMRQQMGLPVSRPGMLFTENDLDREEIVRTKILAEWATQMGMVVPDTEIAEHLRQISDNKLSWEEMRAILRGGQNTTYKRSIKAVNELIREKLLAQKAIALSFAALGELTPGQQFGYFARSNRQIEMDVLEIPVSAFVDQVAEPESKTLQAYFDKYKYQTPLFNSIAGVSYKSPEPGFKLPHRVAVDYVKVNADQEIEKWLDQVTDEEIATYYEENKRMDQQLHVVDALDLPDAEDFAPDGASNSEDAGASDAEPQPAEEEAGSGDDADASAVPSAAPDTKEEKATPTPQEGSKRSSRARIRQVAFTGEEAENGSPTSDTGVGNESAENESVEDIASAEDASTSSQSKDEGAAADAGGSDGAVRKEPTYK